MLSEGKARTPMWTTVVLAVLAVTGVVGLRVSFRSRLDRATRSTDPRDAERAEALRQVSRDIERGRAAGHGLY